MAKLKSIPSKLLKRSSGWSLIYEATDYPATITNGDYRGLRVWFGDEPDRTEPGIWVKPGDVVDVEIGEKLYGRVIEDSEAWVAITQRIPS